MSNNKHELSHFCRSQRLFLYIKVSINYPLSLSFLKFWTPKVISQHGYLEKRKSWKKSKARTANPVKETNKSFTLTDGGGGSGGGRGGLLGRSGRRDSNNNNNNNNNGVYLQKLS